MSYQLIWSPDALLDLAEHFDFLKQRNLEAAGKAAQSIRDTAFSIAGNPHRGRLVADGSGRRKLIVPFGKSGYVIYYLIKDETIVIVRIYHGRQNRPA
jgi:plasmid stabilization system protein ParE